MLTKIGHCALVVGLVLSSPFESKGSALQISYPVDADVLAPHRSNEGPPLRLAQMIKGCIYQQGLTQHCDYRTKQACDQVRGEWGVDKCP